MAEELKSAWEIALEKTGKFKPSADESKLSQEQKDMIAEIEREYQAKLAEKEIMLQSKIKKLERGSSPIEFHQQAEALRQEAEREKVALQEEKAKKIEAIKKSRP
jgi:uncharacterized membrane protein YkoI